MTDNVSTDADQKLEFRVNDAWAAFAKANPWAVFIPAFAKDPITGQGFMRPEGRTVVYRIASQTPDGKKQEYECAKCDSTILGITVTHPVWDGPFPCSGSGRVESEQVPYCPTCETKPGYFGMPVSR